MDAPQDRRASGPGDPAARADFVRRLVDTEARIGIAGLEEA
ncbi:hypothetical protein OHT77_43425 [Streptomyces sp. NBC_00252]|nr:hypothetical protein [Streptomyces sp. NBC_00252]